MFSWNEENEWIEDSLNFNRIKELFGVDFENIEYLDWMFFLDKILRPITIDEEIC